MHPNEARTKRNVKDVTKSVRSDADEKKTAFSPAHRDSSKTLWNEPDPPQPCGSLKEMTASQFPNPRRETRLKLGLLWESWHDRVKEEDVLSVKSGGWLCRTQKSQGRWGRCGAESPWIHPTFPSGIFPEALHFVFDGWWQV